MSTPVAIDHGVTAELETARQRFQQAASQDARLPILALIDPIRAFRDAGIDLSEAAAEQLRKAYPHHRYDDPDLYQRVREGRTKLPLIVKATLRGEGA